MNPTSFRFVDGTPVEAQASDKAANLQRKALDAATRNAQAIGEVVTNPANISINYENPAATKNMTGQVAEEALYNLFLNEGKELTDILENNQGVVPNSLLEGFSAPVGQALNFTTNVADTLIQLGTGIGQTLKAIPTWITEAELPEAVISAHARMKAIDAQRQAILEKYGTEVPEGVTVPQYDEADVALIKQINPKSGVSYEKALWSIEQKDAQARKEAAMWDSIKLSNTTALGGIMKNIDDAHEEKLKTAEYSLEKYFPEAANYRDASDLLSKLANAFTTGGSELIKDPATVAQLIGSSLPYFIAPFYAATASATDMYTQGRLKFIKENNRLPTETESRQMAAIAAAYAGASFIGDRGVLKAAKGEAANALTASSAVMKAAQLVGNTARPMVKESFAEGYQSGVESGWNALSPADAKDIGFGAAAGGVIAGSLTIPGSVKSSLTNNQEEEEDTQESAVASTEQIKKINAAVESIKTSTDVTVQAEAIETIKANIDELSANVDKATAEYEKAKEVHAKGQAAIDEITAKFTKHIEDLTASGKLTPEIESNLIGLRDARIAETQKILSIPLENFEGSKQQAELVLKAANDKAFPALKNANKVDEVTSILTSYPTAESAAKAKRLAEDMTNNLTEQQRNSLRLFSEAVTIANENKTVEDVSNYVTVGGTDSAKQRFFGLNDYLKEASKAFATGNMRYLGVLANRLERFMASHEGKQAAIEQAYANTPKGYFTPVLRSGDEWVLGEMQPMSAMTDQVKADSRKNGGVLVHPSSTAIVEAVSKEVAAINKLMEYMDTLLPTSDITPADLGVDTELQAILDSATAQPETQPVPEPSPENVPEPSPENVPEPSPENVPEPSPENVPQEAPVSAPSTVSSPVATNPTPEALPPETASNAPTATPVDTPAPMAATPSKPRPFARLPAAIKTKEQAKIDTADSFIGKGAEGTSTAHYEAGFGELANKGTYEEGERVFVSVNGNRNNRVPFSAIQEEVATAIEAGATLITDDNVTSFNVGEKELADYLTSRGMVKTSKGNYAEWTSPNPEEDLGDIGTSTVEIENTTNDVMPTTDNIEDSTVENEPDVDKVTEEKVTKEPSLSALKGDKEAAKENLKTNFQKTNVVLAAFSQKANALLAKASNLMFDLFGSNKTREQQMEYLSNLTGISKEELTPQHFKLLRELEAMAKFAQKLFENNGQGLLKFKGDPSFNYQDYTQYLMYEDANGNPLLDENVYLALATAAFSYLNEKSSIYKKEKEVALLLGSGNSEIPSHIYRKYATKGDIRTKVIESLGERAFKALGLSLDKDMPTVHQEKLMKALGGLAYVVMSQANMLETSSMSAKEFLSDSNSDKNNSAKKGVAEANMMYALENGIDVGVGNVVEASSSTADPLIYFTRPTVERNAEGFLQMGGRAKTVKDLMKTLGKEFADLFGAVSGKRYPSLKPINRLARTVINKAGTQVPKILERAAIRMQQEPYTVDADLVKVYRQLYAENPEQLLILLGATPLKDIPKLHVTKRDAAMAVREGLMRSLENMFETLDRVTPNEDGTYPEMYFPIKIWEVNRLGVDSNMFNEQGDKVHRSVLNLSRHKTTITIDSGFDEKGNITPYGYFLLAIGTNMEGISWGTSSIGRKITVDKTQAKYFIPAIIKYLETSETLQTSIDALNAYKKGDPSNISIYDVGDAIKEFGSTPMAFQALNAIAVLKDAIASGSNTFETNISYGSDGITNGVIISEMIYGTIALFLMKAGGLYTEADGIKNMLEYRDANGKDFYEIVGESMKLALNNMASNISSKYLKNFNEEVTRPKVIAAMNSLLLLDNTFGTRAGAKIIATPFNYGAGFPSINRRLTSDLIESFYTQLAEASNNEDAATVETLINAINAVLSVSPKEAPLITSIDVKKALDFELTTAQMAAIYAADALIRGKATSEALKEVAGNLIETRNRMLAATNFGQAIFKQLWEQKRDQYIQENIANGVIATRVTKKGELISISGLTREQEIEVLRLLAQYNSSVNSVSGIWSSNTAESAHNTYTFTYTGGVSSTGGMQQQFAKPFRVPFINNGRAGELKTITHATNAPALENRGAGMSAVLIQAIDAYITARTSSDRDLPTSNRHDENGVGLADVRGAAINQNAAFFSAMAYYNIGLEVVQSYLKPLQGLLNEANKLGSKERTAYLRKHLMEAVKAIPSINSALLKGEILTADMIYTAVTDMTSELLRADHNKYKKLMLLKYINQYGTEGGSFVITAAHQKQLSKLYDDWLVKATETNQAVADLLDGLLTVAAAEEQKRPSSLSYAEDGSVSLEQVSKYLEAVLSPTQKLVFKLLGKSLTANAANISIKIVDVNNLTKVNLSSDYEANATKKGWVLSKTNGSHEVVINLAVMNNDQLPEVLLHELVHAAINLGLQSNINKPKSAIMKNIVSLQAALKTIRSNYEWTDEEETLLNAAEKDPYEFVAVALSNIKIMKALKETPATEAASSFGALVINAWNVFVETVKELLGVTPLNTSPATMSALEQAMQVAVSAMQSKPKNAMEVLTGYPEELTEVNASTPLELFQKLDGNLSKNFSNTLERIFISGINTQAALLQQAGLLSSSNNTDPASVLSSLDKNAFVNQLRDLGFVMSDKEAYAVSVIEIAVQASFGRTFNSPVYKQVRKAYDEAAKRITLSSFLPNGVEAATETDRIIAANKRNAIFGVTKENRDVYLARFVALAVANESFSNMLGFTFDKPVPDSKTPFGYLVAYANSAINFMNGLLTRTLNIQTVQNKVPVWVSQLIAVDSLARMSVLNLALNKWINVEDTANAAAKKLRDKVANLIDMKPSANPSKLRGVVRLTQAMVKGTFDQLYNIAMDIRNFEMQNEPLGFVASLLNEFTPNDATQNALAPVMRHHTFIQGIRMSYIEAAKRNINSLFPKGIADRENVLITKLLLKPVVKPLISIYGLNGVIAMMSNISKRNEAIKNLENQLQALPDGGVMIVRAKQLAQYVMTETAPFGLAKNAEAIAMHVGLPSMYRSVAPQQAVDLINKLVPLYSMAYIKSSDAKALAAFEKDNTQALLGVINFYDALSQEAIKTTFKDNPINRIHGYVPEITNPHVSLEVATTPLEERELALKGYQKVGLLDTSQLDQRPVKPTLWKAGESVQERYVTGALSTNRTKHKGTSATQGYPDKKSRYLSLRNAEKTIEAHLLSLAAKAGSYSPTSEKGAVIASYDAEGRVIDFYYEASGFTRDTLLERNQRMSDVLAAYAGSNVDRINVTKHNKLLTDMLVKDWKANGAKEPHKYVRVSLESDNPRVREAYAVIPPATRKAMEEAFGGNIMVRNNIFDIVFGYSKYSVGDSFDTAKNARNAIEKVLVGFAEMIMPKNGRLKTMKVDRVWQEIVQFVKNAVVIRNLTTLLGNLHANFLILGVMGINPILMVRDSIIALRAAMQFKKDQALFVQTKQKELMFGSTPAIKADLLRISDSLRKNPMKQFFEAGMMPTIVEDVALENDPFSYQSKLQQEVAKRTKWIPQGVKTVANWAFVNQGTPLYSFLSEATQYSDFIAKYLVVKHLTSKSVPVSFEDALNVADTLFISYDVPTSKAMQALNDRGFLMFTKYYVRIQRAIGYMYNERPASLLMNSMIAIGLGSNLTAIEPFLLSNLGNPFTVAPLSLPSALTEPLPIKLLLGLL